jgi:DNA-nicking Smr family endonuclease
MCWMTKKRTPLSGAGHNEPADTDAFRAAMQGVMPLKSSPRHDSAPPKRRPRKHKPVSDALDDIDRAMPLISAAAEDDTGSASLSFQRGGVRDQVMRRLRRGLYPTEGELDLHGLTQTAARDRLADFISRSREMGRRSVRVVHGKGYRSGARGPILKSAVNLWLRRHLDVMAFTSAKAIDGGTGAVYVLLRA